jgi:hypothetical protein
MQSFHDRVLPKAMRGEPFKKELTQWIQLFFRSAERAYATLNPEDWAPTYVKKSTRKD